MIFSGSAPNSGPCDILHLLAAEAKQKPKKCCNRCIVVDLSCNCEACSLDAPGVVTPDTAPDISEPN